MKAGVLGDQDLVRTIAGEIAAQESSKKHDLLAERIVRALNIPSPTNGKTSSKTTSLTNQIGANGIHHHYVDRPISSLFLEKSTLKICHEFIEEQDRADILRAHGIEPRHRILLYGPLGNGKTSLAESLSYELALPLFTVRYDMVVTSYLGETAKRFRNLFDFVRTEPCILFF